MLLRDVRPDDLDAYVRMRTDPAMMAELGGPVPRESLPEKVRRDARNAAAGTEWILMIAPDADPDVVAGTVSVFGHEVDGVPLSEIGWMVLPEFQGRGLAKRAVRAVLERAREQRRWGRVHAFPGVTNGPSNGLCRSVGFTLLGEREFPYNGAVLRVNHWSIDPAADLPQDPGQKGGRRPTGMKAPANTESSLRSQASDSPGAGSRPAG